MSEKIILPSRILDVNRILLKAEAENKKRIFEEIGLVFENTDGPPRGSVFKHLLERERLGSTVISDGVAIPHARIDSLTKPMAAYLRADKPINYDGSNQLVRHLFVLLVPEKADDTHLKILSVMSRILTDKEFIEAANNCNDRQELLQEIVNWENNNLPATIQANVS